MNLSNEDRLKILQNIQSQSMRGQESLGTSIRRLRLEITGLDQATFAKMCKMTVKTLSSLENDKGNPTINTLNSILRPFGMQMALGLLLTLTSSVRFTTPPKIVGGTEKFAKRGANPKRLRNRVATPVSRSSADALRSNDTSDFDPPKANIPIKPADLE